MTTSWTTRAGAITLVALIAAAGCSSKTHSTSANSSAPASTPPASSAPAVSSPAAPSTSAPASSGPAVSSPANPATTAPAAPPSSTAAVSLAGFKPASVTFVSATQGFVLGAQTCATGMCTILASTVDGGSTWTYAGAGPAAVSGPNPAVSKVRFATKNDGWAFGPQLWSTHDGGHTWRQFYLLAFHSSG